MVLSRLYRLFDFIWPLSNESFLAQYIILLSNDCGVSFLFSLGVLFVICSCLSVFLVLSALDDLYCLSAAKMKNLLSFNRTCSS